MFFKTFNQTIYSIYYFLNSLHTYFITLIFFHFSSNKIKKSFQNNPSGNANNLLFISWGFIGDALLSTSILRYFRDTFPGCKVIILGRETAKELLEPFCDEYIEFLPDKWKASSSYRKNLFQNLSREYKIVVGDIHLFNGGIFYMKNLIELLSAKFKFYYRGYFNGKTYAPFRLIPRNTTIIEPPPKITDSQHHTVNDYFHYFNEIAKMVNPDWRSKPLDICFRPLIDLQKYEENSDISRFGLENENYIVCQLVSNNPKRDYPLKRWEGIFNSLPETKFVILGADRDLKKTSHIHSHNVVDLCGKTSIKQAVVLINHSKLFIGLDSGLSHVATVLGKNTICIIENSKYGYFFPYPDFLNYHDQITIYNKKFMDCKRCFMVCTKENIFKNYFESSKCLREISGADVISEIKKRL